MKHSIPLLTLLLICCNTCALHAQETAENELELVKQLRAKGWYDLARTRSEQLLKRGDPVLAAAVPLELARVNIAEARQKDPEQRLTLFTAARGQLQEYIKKNAGKAEAALASGELARLTSYHAQSLLSKAMREEEVKVRHERARPAEAKFIEAGKDLAAAIKAIEAALADPNNSPLKTLLTNELKQARFDVAVNIFDQARTYIDRSKFEVDSKRSETMAMAIKSFTALRSDESSEIGWLANAWLMKLNMEITVPEEVNKFYEFVNKRKDDKANQPSIQPAVRLIRYFHLQDLTLPREDPETIGNNAIAGKNPKLKITPPQRLDGVIKEADLWLKAYPAHLKTYEGQGVLFELAYAFFTKASLEKDQKNAGPTYDKAIKYFDQLADLEGDQAERARQMSMSIKFKRLDTKADLKTFDENLMKAMIERRTVIKLSQDIENPKLGDPKKLEEDRKKHLKEVITSLNKALVLATTKTPIQKVDDARYYLCGAYLAYGDLYRGAIVAEALGRSRTTRRSPEGASTAIATYSTILNREPNNTSVRARLQDMAEFVLSPESARTWKDEPVTSMAHYHLAMAAQRDNQPKKAIEHLEKVDKDFTDYVYTQGQLAFIAVGALEKAEDKKEQKQLVATAKAAIARMPKINPKSESSTIIAMYFYAKLENAKLLYREAIEDLNAREELKAIAKCKDMAKYVKDLTAEFEPVPQHIKAPADDDYVPNGRISKANHEQLQFTMQIMLKYADLGIAEVRFRSDSKDRFEQVVEATKTVVEGTLAKAKAAPAGAPLRLKDYRVTGDILGLALRANVQKGDVDKGKAILDVLQRLSGPNPDDKPGPVVAVLLNDIAGQIDRMKKDQDPALKTTSGKYMAFLDVIAKEFETKGFDNNSAILLAHAFNSLDFPSKAASMFAKVKAFDGLDKKIVKKANETEDEQKAREKWELENNRHWGVQVEYVRALRATKDKDSAKEAATQVEALLKHPNATYKIQAMMEKNLLLEDDQKYRAAFGEWQKFMKQPALKDLTSKDVRQVYFAGYVHSARTLYKTGVLDPMIKDRPKLITAAANMIIKLEFSKSREGWEIAGPLFREMLKDKENESLKTEYDRLKAGQ